VVDKGVDEALRMEEKTRDGGNVAKPTVGREEVPVRLELWWGAVVIRPPMQMRGRGKGRGSGVVLPSFLNGMTAGQGREEGGQWHGTTHAEGDGGGSDRRVASRPTVARPWCARASWHCLNRGAPGASDAWAPTDRGRKRERERREARRVGLPGEKGKWAEPEGIGGFFIYSNRIQTSSNGFDQKVVLKIPNKISLERVWDKEQLSRNLIGKF
jgi:hypothetical protein